MTASDVSQDLLRRLQRDAKVFGVPRIAAEDITPLAFYREYVAPRKPCIITGALESWPAFHLWDADLLKQRMQDTPVTVAATPNGRADALTEVSPGELRFMRPEERTMPFTTFADALTSPSSDTVLYAQKQNNSFAEEYTPLHRDVHDNVRAFGEEVFGCPTDAANFWMGGDTTVSSMHRDHYENLYSVIRGTKKFTLVAPWEASLIPYTPQAEGVWRRGGEGEGVWEVDRLDTTVRWVGLDPNSETAAEEHPAWGSANPLRIEVRAGETLYLPSLWFHEVGQYGNDDNLTIAVNYWYDIQYSTNFYLLEAAWRMALIAKGEEVSEDEDEE